ncbi:EAL domain-containing protein [Pseudomonas syringae group genomosp. 3]|nr:EAL domain-containing protein [Pseudomonas syringae group genomosp. 3]
MDGRTLPPHHADLAKVLSAAGHSASCGAGLLMAGSPLGWEVITSFGPTPPAATESWLRLTTSYGDVVITGSDESQPFQGQSLVCVAVRGANHELLGAFLMTRSAPYPGMSAAQRYALLTHAAHMRSHLQPSGVIEKNGYDPRSLERLRLLESVVINAKDAILITEAEPIDKPGPRIVYCNPSFLATTGFTEEEVIGFTPRILHCPQTCRETLDVVREALSKWKPVEVELINARKDGSHFWVQLSIVPVSNESGWFTHWVSVQRDITERKDAQGVAEQARLEWDEKVSLQSRLEERERISEELSHKAFHDELTELNNRAYLMSELTQAFESTVQPYTRGTILFLDLDGFKLINDSMGHRAGDLLLTLVASRLQACIRADDVLARIGGDEFAILVMGEHHPEVAVRLAQRIVEQLKGPMNIEGQEIFISCSIGIVTADESHLTSGDLLRDADVAMYAAKKQGRGRWIIFDSSMRKAAIDALAIQSALRQSVVKREFFVLYQPIYCGLRNSLIGVEALVRWAHPVWGVISPDDFIHIAEDLGIIHELGAWVMHMACKEVQTWREYFPNVKLRLNVNVSGKELSRPGFVDQTTRILSETGLPAELMQIEVTESVFLQQPEAIALVLEDVRRAGVRVALDDFGTGYSSLGYIDRYPIDAVKIDRSFVSRMMSFDRSKAIVISILSLGRALDLEITAEGVETAEQFELLQHMRCPYFQGYFLSPPLQAEDMVKVIARSLNQGAD